MNIDIIDASDFVEKLNEMLGGGKYFGFRDDNTKKLLNEIIPKEVS